MNKSIHEIMLYSIIPNIDLLDSGQEFIIQDLIPPIFWNKYSDHINFGILFSDIINTYYLPVKRINSSGTAKYKKL